MVPDLECSTQGGGEVEVFQLYDVDHGKEKTWKTVLHNHTGNLALPPRLRPMPATKMASFGTNVNHLPPQDIDIDLNLPTSPKELPYRLVSGFKLL